MISTVYLLASTATTVGSAVPSITPTASLPGSNLLHSLLGGIAFYGLLFSILALIISAIAMAIGGHSSNGRLADKGRSGLIASLIAAVVCGGAVALVNFAFSQGATIR